MSIRLSTFLILSLLAAVAVTIVHGWSILPPPRRRCRTSSSRKLINLAITNTAKATAAVAIAGGAVIATTAGVATAAVSTQIQQQIQTQQAAQIYNPPSNSMLGKVVVITGGSSGLGLESAKRLAAAGAIIVLTSRTEMKGRKAVNEVTKYLIQKGRLPLPSTSTNNNNNVYSLVLNLDDLSDVQEFASRYVSLNLNLPISILINNAGVMAIPTREVSINGNERTFQSNHLGHFVLTNVLLPYFNTNTTTSGTRIITVASTASNIVGPTGLDLSNLNSEMSYSAWGSYGISKLANILFTRELQSRATTAKLDWLTAITLHPGVVNTDLWRYIIGEERFDDIKNNNNPLFELVAPLLKDVTQLFTKTPEQGASTQIYLAATDNNNIVKGAYYDEMKVQSLPSFATDDEKARLLWEASERLTGIRFDFNMIDSEQVSDTTTSADVIDDPLASSSSSSGGGTSLTSVDYDAAARLAYEDAGSVGDFDMFKLKYLEDMSAMVAKKKRF
jgi:NAD(P)-dependent dehydrogenase (short-subunit alcohol dehydrogenase family)